MKASDALPPELWPFCASEIYAFVLNGPTFVFDEPAPPRAALIIDDIRSDKLELARALKYLRRPNLRPLYRQRAAARVVELRTRLVEQHLWLRGLSIGWRASPRAAVRRWP